VEPVIDWRQRDPKGGYFWDFAHACPPGTPRVLDPHLADSSYSFTLKGFPTMPPIRMEAERDGSLYISFSENEPLARADYCTPNATTFVVSRPGPRGTVIPYRFDMFRPAPPVNMLVMNGYLVAPRPRLTMPAWELKAFGITETPWPRKT
jgi:hypothetical protein